MEKNNFLRGAFILMVAGVLVKVIGSVNRIILSRMLGGEGVGLYQMAYPVYLLALSVSSAGIPAAISILVAERLALGDERGAQRVFGISLRVMLCTGLLFSVLLYIGAGWLVDMRIVRDERAYYALAALSPAIFFVTVLASYRGYFQGLQRMTPTAVSQVAEQAVRVATMVALTLCLAPYGLEYAAAGASFGAAPGAACGVLVLLWYYRRYKLRLKTQALHCRKVAAYTIIKRIVTLALPVSLANIMLPLTANIDLLVVPARLEEAGYSVVEATELFGYLTGMAVTLINLPTILTASLSASLVPAVSESRAVGDVKSIRRHASAALRLAIAIMAPSFIGLYVLAAPISELLYATPNAGECIAILSAGVVLLGIGQVTTGVLHGMGYTFIPLVNMTAAAAAKVALSWALTASWGIAGAAWATNADFGLAALLNLYFVRRYVGKVIEFKRLFKAAVSAAVMGLAVQFSYGWMMTAFFNNTLATLTAILIGGIVYSVMIVVTRALPYRDIENMPFVGRRLARMLMKMNLLE